jgi:hypothetical protein
MRRRHSFPTTSSSTAAGSGLTEAWHEQAVPTHAHLATLESSGLVIQRAPGFIRPPGRALRLGPSATTPAFVPWPPAA